MPNNEYELPSEPTNAEWAEAERRGSLFALEVEGEYEIRGGVLRATERGRDSTSRTYFPMATRGVLGEFSLLPIGDEASLCAFADRWGLLGFDRLGRAALGGDPVAWVWAHLAGIQTVIRLHRIWRKRDTDSAVQVVDGSSISRRARFAFASVNTLIERREFVEAQERLNDALAPAVATDDHYWPGMSVICGDGGRVNLHLLARPRPGEEPLASMWRMMSVVMNPNIRGVYPQMNHWMETMADASPMVQGWDSLISVIYRHLFDVVVGGNVQDCRECGTPFVQTDGRQRFCPPSFSRESTCAMRFHKRRQRSRSRAPEPK